MSDLNELNTTFRPVPTPQIASLSEMPPELADLHLTNLDPLDSPEHVALQVALLTADVARLMSTVAILSKQVVTLTKPSKFDAAFSGRLD